MTAASETFFAYHYSFDATGVAEIDRILKAVASAGHGCHNTEDWNEHNLVEPIQEAANAAAAQLRAAAPSEDTPRAEPFTSDDLDRVATNLREMARAAFLESWPLDIHRLNEAADAIGALRAATPKESLTAPTDTERLDWWFRCGMDDSVCDGSVDLWWATEINGDATTVVTHGTSLRDTLDKAMQGIYGRRAAVTPKTANSRCRLSSSTQGTTYEHGTAGRLHQRHGRAADAPR